MSVISRIASILLSANYKQLLGPFGISSVPFDFTAAFVGDEKTLELILVVDLFFESDEGRLLHKIQSLGKALDMAESRRSITTVLFGPPMDPETIQSMTKVCRVLNIGNPAEDDKLEQYLRDWLSVLLPLPILNDLNAITDWRTELLQQAGASADTTFFKSVLDASQAGSEAVETRLADAVRRNALASMKGQSQ